MHEMTLHELFFGQARAGESLLKLISDLKQFLILNDFSTVNNAISNNTQRYRQLQELIDQRIVRVRDEMASDLVELENEYYSSPNKG